MKLFEAFKSRHLDLQNHIAMAPLTRSRAIGNLPNQLMADYYGQRAGAGLIITEGTSPSPNGLGYPNIPGAYSDEQTQGWKLSTDAVHQKGSKIFMQIMHTGRITAKENLPEGAEVLAPSAIQASGDVFTFEGMKPYTMPKEMTKEDISNTINEYVVSAENAIKAGFDGVEVHCANGYLPNQFLNPGANHRKDEYGGSVENRTRFALEVTHAIAEKIGSGKVGVRISPYGVFNDMSVYDSIQETYKYLVDALNKLDLAYLHLLDVRALGGEAPEGFLLNLVKNYEGAVMFNGGMATDLDRAEKVVEMKENYLISIGAPFISNPDLVSRLQNGEPLAIPDESTFYTPTAEGYTTYPIYAG